MRSARSPLATIGKLVAASLLLATTARADDCPPGSVQKTEDGFSWCQPSVCANDAQCGANEVCRPSALCMEVGTLADAGATDGGKRLVVTQRCVAGQQPGDPKTCPQKQTCSDMSRCMSKATAEKLGLLNATAASAAPPASTDAKKSACGCDVVGASHGLEAVPLLGLALVLAGARRRRVI